MLRVFFAIFIFTAVVIICFAGFRGGKSPNPPIEIFRDMDHQPKFQPQHPSDFFADGRAARQPVAGTVPMGYTVKGAYLQTSAQNGTLKAASFANFPTYYHTGRIGEVYGDGFPTELEITESFIRRGGERFDINCSPCHGRTGQGNGIVGQFGLVAIANLHDERIRTMPEGQLYSVITNGKNTMGAYGPNLSVDDRWAIIAYLRTLQKSQHMKLADLPEAKQKELQSLP